MPATRDPLVVTSAEGVRLRLADGRDVVDGMSSWWAAIHGYRHPVLDAAVRDQLDRMSHVMFGGLTHEPAVRLGYHGDTFGAMAVCDPVGGMHHLFADVLPAHVFADLPPLGYGTPVDP